MLVAVQFYFTSRKKGIMLDFHQTQSHCYNIMNIFYLYKLKKGKRSLMTYAYSIILEMLQRNLFFADNSENG